MRILTAVMTLLATSALAQDIRDPALITKLAAGVLCAPEVTGTVPAPDTVAGVTNVIDRLPPFISRSRTVPAVIGVGFAVTTTSAVELPEVRIEVTHPPMGPDGITVESYPGAIWTDGSGFAMYQFDYDYELVTGPWTVAAFLDTQELWSVTFDVVAPADVPGLAIPCGYQDLLS
jgi:Domain of unknown function (DUF3859)